MTESLVVLAICPKIEGVYNPANALITTACTQTGQSTTWIVYSQHAFRSILEKQGIPSEQVTKLCADNTVLPERHPSAKTRVLTCSTSRAIFTLVLRDGEGQEECVSIRDAPLPNPSASRVLYVSCPPPEDPLGDPYEPSAMILYSSSIGALVMHVFYSQTAVHQFLLARKTWMPEETRVAYFVAMRRSHLPWSRNKEPIQVRGFVPHTLCNRYAIDSRNGPS